LRPGSLPVVDAGGARDTAAAGVLLDARVPPRYRGETEPVDPVAGRIPGAVNQPAAETVDAEGRLRAPADLRARFHDLGVRAERPVAAYCGSGVTAAQTVLALTVAGFDAALYVGSWSNWITDPDRPVATGEVPLFLRRAPRSPSGREQGRPPQEKPPSGAPSSAQGDGERESAP
jgi:thiosulfate/3-mercaptopyruvate sulfurtransferase